MVIVTLIYTSFNFKLRVSFIIKGSIELLNIKIKPSALVSTFTFNLIQNNCLAYEIWISADNFEINFYLFKIYKRFKGMGLRLGLGLEFVDLRNIFPF